MGLDSNPTAHELLEQVAAQDTNCQHAENKKARQLDKCSWAVPAKHVAQLVRGKVEVLKAI